MCRISPVLKSIPAKIVSAASGAATSDAEHVWLEK
jgi:hypothetical protein